MYYISIVSGHSLSNLSDFTVENHSTEVGNLPPTVRMGGSVSGTSVDLGQSVMGKNKYKNNISISTVSEGGRGYCD